MNILKHIPNTITSMNLLCGVLGVVCVLHFKSIEFGFTLMILAAVFDFFDGLAARALNVSSPIGKELDSLADLVSFGVLPSVLLFEKLFMNDNIVWCFISLIIPIFSALRLAKFNLDTRQSKTFIGLPTPACAMICGSYATITTTIPTNIEAYIVTIGSIVLSLLLVSEIPMFSMKFSKEDKLSTKITRLVFFSLSAIIAVFVLVMEWQWQTIILTMFLLYLVINIGIAILNKFQKTV